MIDRETQFKVVDRQSVLAILQRDFSVLQAFAVEAAEKRREHFSSHAFVGMLPIDIEKIKERRSFAVFQDVHEHAVLPIVGHVIGHDILDPTQSKPPHVFVQRLEFFLAAELRIDLIGIDHVIAVQATRSCMKNRRRVNIGDAESMQIRQNCAASVKPNSGVNCKR